jgi:hypothetical protein
MIEALEGVLLSSDLSFTEFQVIPEPAPSSSISQMNLRASCARNPNSFCERLSKEFPDVRCIVPEKGELLPFYWRAQLEKYLDFLLETRA